ncbi:MAG: hypothetical protein Q8P18_27260 [Pseudomonadota bacterium]|nr:hypothetical protein [Pseudomonadota bacterium]
MSRRAPRASRIAPLLLALFAPGIASAATAVVTPLVAKGVDAKVIGAVTGLISSELDFSGAFETVTELPAAPSTLNEKCLTSTSCLGAIAKSAGVDSVLTGIIAPGGKGILVSLVLYDAGKNTIRSKATFDVASDPGTLADNAGKWVKQIVSGQSPAATAAAAAPPPSFSDEEEDGFAFESEPKPTASKPKSTTSTSKSGVSDGPVTSKTRIDTSGSKARTLSDEEDDGDDFEMEDTSAADAAKAKADAAAKAAAKAKADAAAKAKAEAEAEAKAEAEAQAAAKAKAKADAERRAREDAERLAREEEEAEEASRQAARAKAEAARRQREAAEAEEEEDASASSSGDDEDFSFGSSVGLMAIETEDAEEEEAAEVEEDEEEEEAPRVTSRSTSSSRSTASSSRATSRDLDEDLDEDLGEDEEEDPDAEEEDEDLADFDEDEEDKPRSRSSSRPNFDEDEDDRDSRSSRSSSSSRTSGSSSASRRFDEDDRGSRSSTRIEKEDAKPGIGLAVRGGYSRYFEFNFVTYGAELAIPVAPTVQIIAGIEGFSTQRQYSENVVSQLAIEQGVDESEINPNPWQTILPINFGVLYKSSKNAVRPYGGLDLTLTPYTKTFDLALGARGRAGADFMVADNFGLNLNLSVGIIWGEKLDQMQKDVEDVGVIPQISAGTVFQF